MAITTTSSLPSPLQQSFCENMVTCILPPPIKKVFCRSDFLKPCKHRHVFWKDRVKCAIKRRKESGSCWKYHSGFCPVLLSVKSAEDVFDRIFKRKSKQ